MKNCEIFPICVGRNIENRNGNESKCVKPGKKGYHAELV